MCFERLNYLLLVVLTAHPLASSAGTQAFSKVKHLIGFAAPVALLQLDQVMHCQTKLALANLHCSPHYLIVGNSFIF